MKTELHELRLPNRTVRCPVELRARRIVLRPRFGDYDGAVFDEGDPVFRWLTTIVEQYRHDPRPLYFDYAPPTDSVTCESNFTPQSKTQPNPMKGKRMKSEKDQTDGAMEKLSPAEASELVNRIVDLMAALEVIDFALLMRLHDDSYPSGYDWSISELNLHYHERNALIDAFEGLKAALQRMGIYQELKPAMKRMGIYYPYTWNQLVEGADAETTAELAEWTRRNAEIDALFVEPDMFP